MYSLDVKIQELAQQIAIALSGDWQVEFEQDSDWGFYLRRKNSFSLSVHYDKHKNKFNIKPEWKKLREFLPSKLKDGYWNGDNWQKDKWDGINVSSTRQPKMIAKDIERRLLVVVLPERENAVDRQQASNNQREMYGSLMQKYALAIESNSFDSAASPYETKPISQITKNAEIEIWSVDTRSNTAQVKLEVKGLSVDATTKLVAFLKEL